MADLGTLTIGTFDSTNSTWDGEGGTGPSSIAATNDSNYVGDNDNNTRVGETEVAYYSFDSVPGDFGDIDTLLINLGYYRDANNADKTWDILTARIYASDRTTPYTDLLTVASSITTTSGTTSGATGFTINATGLAATAANWNAAVMSLHIARTKIKGGNADDFRVTAADLTGTYTISGGQNDIDGSSDFSVSTAGALEQIHKADGTAELAVTTSGALEQVHDVAGSSALAITTAGDITNVAINEIAGSSAFSITMAGGGGGGTIDASVGASADDAYVRADDTQYSHVDTGIRANAHTGGQEYDSGFRFTGISGLSGATIDVAYIRIRPTSTGFDDANVDISAEDAEAPPTFSSGNNPFDRTSTTASVPWVADSLGDSQVNSPSLVGPIQELADSYDPSAIVILFRGKTDIQKSFTIEAWDHAGTLEAELHIEFSGAGSPVIQIQKVDDSAALAVSTSGELEQTHSFAGTSALAVTAVGDITNVAAGIIPIDGSAALAVTTSGALEQTHDLAGTSALAITAAGTVVQVVEIAGSAALAITTTGDLKQTHTVAGSSALAIAVTAALKQVQVVSGSSALAITTAGVVREVLEVAGSVALAVTTTGDITNVAAGVIPIAGTVTISVTTSGNLEQTHDVSGNSALAVATDGDLKQIHIIDYSWAFVQGYGIGVFFGIAASGGVEQVHKAEGTSALAVTTDGNLEQRHAVAGTSAFAVTTSGNLGQLHDVTGTSALAITADGELVQVQEVAGAVAISISTAGDIANTPAAVPATSGHATITLAAIADGSITLTVVGPSESSIAKVLVGAGTITTSG